MKQLFKVSSLSESSSMTFPLPDLQSSECQRSEVPLVRYFQLVVGIPAKSYLASTTSFLSKVNLAWKQWKPFNWVNTYYSSTRERTDFYWYTGKREVDWITVTLEWFGEKQRNYFLKTVKHCWGRKVKANFKVAFLLSTKEKTICLY